MDIPLETRGLKRFPGKRMITKGNNLQKGCFGKLFEFYKRAYSHSHLGLNMADIKSCFDKKQLGKIIGFLSSKNIFGVSEK